MIALDALHTDFWMILMGYWMSGLQKISSRFSFIVWSIFLSMLQLHVNTLSIGETYTTVYCNKAPMTLEWFLVMVELKTYKIRRFYEVTNQNIQKWLSTAIWASCLARTESSGLLLLLASSNICPSSSKILSTAALIMACLPEDS